MSDPPSPCRAPAPKAGDLSPPVIWLNAALVALAALVAAGPTLVGLTKALPVLVLALALGAALLRLVWFVTSRQS